MKGDLVELRMRGIGAGGVGVSDLPDGRVVFVARTAPGDLVRVRVTKEKERWARGEVEEILEEGEGRTTPPCPRYEECDGCSLQHLTYEEQRRWKSRIIGDALRRIGGLEVEDPPVEASPESLRYRNKISVIFRRLAGGRVVAGFHHRLNRKRILDVGSECLLPEPALADLWGALREGWGPGGRWLPEGGELRLILRVGGEGGTLLIQGGRGDGSPKKILEAVPGLTSLWRLDKGGRARHVAGEGGFELPWLDDTMEVAGGAFLQVNQSAGEALHRHVLAVVGEVTGQSVVEGYCGAGILGRELATRGASGVVGIEMDPLSLEEARRQAPQGFEVVSGKVEERLGEFLPADLVLLNPPRGGVDPRVPQLLDDHAVPRVVYVSCDPATLARDLKRLGNEYSIVALAAFDLFPQTGHVETVVSLKRR